MTGAALLLGGGAVGRAVAAALGRDRAFERVIVADRCRHRAAAAAERCGGKAVAVRLDCADDAAVAPLLREVSLALNTAELPPEVLLPLIRSVVEAGVSYADANDDPQSLQAVFDSEYLSALAGHRGVSVLPGLGASPGQTNTLARYLSQRLDRIDAARFYQLDDLRLRRPGQWRRRLAAFGAPALVWRDGGWRHVSPMSEWDEPGFPPPWGRVRCCVVGLQPVTLPASMPTVTEVSSHRGFADAGMERVMGDLVRYGLASDQPVDTPTGRISPAVFAAAFFSGPWAPPLLNGPPLLNSPVPDMPLINMPPINMMDGAAAGLPRQAQVSGLLRGRATRFTLTWRFPEEQEADSVAAPLAVGARMLLARELPAPGVHPPEALDPAPFLWDMERRGVEIQLSKTVETPLP